MLCPRTCAELQRQTTLVLESRQTHNHKKKGWWCAMGGPLCQLALLLLLLWWWWWFSVARVDDDDSSIMFFVVDFRYPNWSSVVFFNSSIWPNCVLYWSQWFPLLLSHPLVHVFLFRVLVLICCWFVSSYKIEKCQTHATAVSPLRFICPCQLNPRDL